MYRKITWSESRHGDSELYRNLKKAREQKMWKWGVGSTGNTKKMPVPTSPTERGSLTTSTAIVLSGKQALKNYFEELATRTNPELWP